MDANKIDITNRSYYTSLVLDARRIDEEQDEAEAMQLIKRLARVKVDGD